MNSEERFISETPTVICFALRGGLIGQFYVDLYARPSKRGSEPGMLKNPRGLMVDVNGNFVSNAMSVVPILGARCEDVELSFLPLAHTFERNLDIVIAHQPALLNQVVIGKVRPHPGCHHHRNHS